MEGEWTEVDGELVQTVVRRFAHTKEEAEELFSVGAVGLIKARKHYDVTRNVTFRTFASRCIENEIRYYYRNASRRKEVAVYEEESYTHLYQAMEEEKHREERIYLWEALRALKKPDRILIDLQFGLSGTELSQKQIAEFLGISQAKVSREKKRILSFLRKELEP